MYRYAIYKRGRGNRLLGILESDKTVLDLKDISQYIKHERRDNHFTISQQSISYIKIPDRIANNRWQIEFWFKHEACLQRP